MLVTKVTWTGVKYSSHHSCDPAVADADCITPLHMACSCGHTTVVQLLLQDRRVDALSEDKYGRN